MNQFHVSRPDGSTAQVEAYAYLVNEMGGIDFYGTGDGPCASYNPGEWVSVTEYVGGVPAIERNA